MTNIEKQKFHSLTEQNEDNSIHDGLDIPTVTNPPSVPSPSMDSTTILS
jgi:hypothetical protein